MRFEIENFRKCAKESVKVATFTIRFPEFYGIIIRDMSYFVKGTNRWISFPQKQYEVEGEKKYFNFISFQSADTFKQLQGEVIRQIDEIQRSVTPTVSPTAKTFQFEEQPPF